MSERTPFTDGKRHVASEYDCSAAWNGVKNGLHFRCYLCGHKFVVGDGYRWVYSGKASFEIDGKKHGVSNFKTCDSCDGPDVIDRWVAMNKEVHTKYWWFSRDS